MTFRPEDIDLAEVADGLRRTFGDRGPTGYLPGRTAFRDALVVQLECSQLEAELVVDTMIARGFLRYEGDPTAKVDELEQWIISRWPQPSPS
jgi:hypothetical protein